MGALVRSAAFGLALTGVHSTTVRGPGIGLFSPSFTSLLWVETNDFRNWTFALGALRHESGIAADWIVTLAVGDTAARVATTNYLTKDDVLVNGEHHDALRTELLRAIALGGTSGATDEAEVSAASLKLPLRFEKPDPEPLDLSFAIVTALAEDTVRKRLRLLGLRVVDDSTTSVRWGLGLPKHQAANHVTIAFTPGVLTGTAHISSTSSSSRRIAATDLLNLISRAHFLIHQVDKTATYHGPADWRP